LSYTPKNDLDFLNYAVEQET